MSGETQPPVDPVPVDPVGDPPPATEARLQSVEEVLPREAVSLSSGAESLPRDAPGYRAAESYRTGDDRSLKFKARTVDWQTDWTLHSVPYAELGSGGVPRDAIPAIDRPQHISISAADAWIEAEEPVVGVIIGEAARAYPLQILTWHEIANDVLAGVPIAVTFCPLCNAALAFDRRFDSRVLDFGVTGLLRNSDLVMWDRQSESLWQQIEGRGIAGAYTGAQLDVLPALLISWADYKAGYPDGDVLSREAGFRKDYGANPYAGYDAIGRQPFLFDGPADGRLQAMERVVTVEQGEDTVAYPYRHPAEDPVVNDRGGDQPVVVFWKSGTTSALDARDIALGRDVGSGTVFDPRVGGDVLAFEDLGDGRFRDRQTGSTWNSLGRAVGGKLAGEQLAPVVHANHFWFAWAAFRPETRVWGLSDAARD